MFRPDQNPPEAGGASLEIVFQAGELVTYLRSPEPCLVPADLVEDNGWQARRRHWLRRWNNSWRRQNGWRWRLDHGLYSDRRFNRRWQRSQNIGVFD